MRRTARIVGGSLMAVGAFTLVNEFGGFNLPFGKLFPEGKTEVTADVGDIHTEVTEYSGKVAAEINATLDVNVVRGLSMFGHQYCVQAVHENDLPLSGLLVTKTNKITIEEQGKRVVAHVAEFEQPKLSLPIGRPILGSSESSVGVCTQKDPGEWSKDMSNKELDKRRKIMEDSPENVPTVIAHKVVEATSTRIAECVLNRANDEGTDVNKLLSQTIAEDIANDRGISPKDVDVFFNFKDTNEGVKELNDVKNEIIKEQKNKADATVKISVKEAIVCELHDISVTLTSNEK